MSLHDQTAATLSATLETPVPDLLVVIAKNSVLGMDPSQLLGMLGITQLELDEITQSELYRNVRMLCANEHAKSQADKDTSWDALEEKALGFLHKKIGLGSDPELLLKVAAVSNKAMRGVERRMNKTLDPANAPVRIPLTLSARATKRYNSGDVQITETREISVLDGTAINPPMAEIESFLTQHGAPSPRSIAPDKAPRLSGVKTRMNDPVSEDLESEMIRSFQAAFGDRE